MKVENYLKDIYLDDMLCNNGEIWFIGTSDNILYKIDNNNQLYPVKMIPYKGKNCFRNNAVCIKDKNMVYCFPERSQNIYVIDIKKNNLREINLDDNEERLGIYNAWVIHNYIWCVSFISNKLYMIDKSSMLVKNTFVLPYKNIPKLDIQAASYEENLYFVSNHSRTILKFNTETKKFCEYEVNCKENGFSTVVVDKSKIYLTGESSILYCYDYKINELEFIDLGKFLKFEKKDHEYSGNVFYRSIRINEYIILSTENISQLISNQIIVYNTQKKEIYACVFEDNNQRKAGDFLVISKFSEEEIIIYDNFNGCIYNYNLNHKNNVKQIVKAGEKILKSFAKDIENIEFTKENAIVDLTKYLQIFINS